jgi:hypothetical protein
MSYRILPSAVLAIALSIAGSGVALAVPTPIPGGANQIKGVTGTLASTIFNGKLRFRKFVLRKSTAAEGTADPGGMALTLTYLVSDGMERAAYGNVGASIVDADGVVVAGHSVGVYGAYYTMQPGASVRGSLYFLMPAGFVPVKILMVPGDGPALRINLKPSDLPAATPATAPTSAPSP